jgi:hypothetical protein
MLFRQRFIEGIRDGSITVAFRRWKRPTVRAGGTLLMPAGQLSIRDVAIVAGDAITDADARRAGYESRDQLLAELNTRPELDLYRIELGPLAADPRVALRHDSNLDEAQLATVTEALRRLDSGADGVWTARVLRLVRDHPGVRAGDLCRSMGQDQPRFKANVRKLKRLGLTESLEVGYRLSERGSAVLRALSG